MINELKTVNYSKNKSNINMKKLIFYILKN